MIPVENLYQGKFDEYSALYIEMPYPISKKGLHLQPSGTYIRAFCKGQWNRLPEVYEKILDYADKKNLVLYGCAYETGINELVIDDIDAVSYTHLKPIDEYVCFRDKVRQRRLSVPQRRRNKMV